MMLSFTDPVHPNFTIKICLDTNILVYYLDKTFPSLSHSLDVLVDYNNFVSLLTTRYVLFELLEVRKRKYFKDSAATVLSQTITDNNCRVFNVPNTPLHYYTLLPNIRNSIIAELNSLKTHTDIKVVGDIHTTLWPPTEDICLNTRLNREDSLVLTSALMPDELIIENFLTVMTNDSNFHKFLTEAPNIDNVFNHHSLAKPTLSYIRHLKCISGREINLLETKPQTEIKEYTLQYIKDLIIQKNLASYVGVTDHRFSTRNPSIIGIKLNGNVTINSHNYLTIISKNLDFVFNCPKPIIDFRDSDGQTQNFPFRGTVGKIVFQWPELPEDDSNKAREGQILSLIKDSGNLVFLHPDSL